MYRILRCLIAMLIVDSSIVNFRVISRAMATVAEEFKASGIDPDVIQNAPESLELLTVNYPNGVSVQLGNELSPTQVTVMPCVSYEANSNQFYTLALVDPDVPSRQEPLLGEFQHWLVGNIPGCDVEAGEMLTAYLGSTPPPLTGLHRYVFLLYQQSGKITFDELRILSLSVSDVNRFRFSISEFAKKYNLGDPIAGNFFLSEIDVPIVDELLGN